MLIPTSFEHLSSQGYTVIPTIMPPVIVSLLMLPRRRAPRRDKSLIQELHTDFCGRSSRNFDRIGARTGTRLQCHRVKRSGLEAGTSRTADCLDVWSFGEELSYRGYLLMRAADMFGRSNLAYWVPVCHDLPWLICLSLDGTGCQATSRRDRPETCKRSTASRSSVTNRWALDPRRQRVEAVRLES